jgi:hypothetical protein
MVLSDVALNALAKSFVFGSIWMLVFNSEPKTEKGIQSEFLVLVFKRSERRLLRIVGVSKGRSDTVRNVWDMRERGR